MGYGIVPDFRSEAVVCQKPCSHTDCAANREDWLQNGTCRVCKKQLEPGEAFYYEPEHGKYAKVHALCVM